MPVRCILIAVGALLLQTHWLGAHSKQTRCAGELGGHVGLASRHVMLHNVTQCGVTQTTNTISVVIVSSTSTCSSNPRK